MCTYIEYIKSCMLSSINLISEFSSSRNFSYHHLTFKTFSFP